MALLTDRRHHDGWTILLWLVGALTALPTHADSPPPPPPPTLEQTVQGATLVIVAKGVDLWPEYRDGKTMPKAPGEPVSERDVGGYLLRAHVQEILYCEKPCPNHAEVVVSLGLFHRNWRPARELFVDKAHIFVLIDRPFEPRLPADLSGKWFARGLLPAGFFVPLNKRAEVLNAIEKYKRGAVR